MWHTNDFKLSFREINSVDWVEIQNDKLFANFKFVEEIGDTVVLLDDRRNLYVSLNSVNVKWGNLKNSITNILVNGKWLILKNFISTNKNLSFKQTSGFDWVEIQNDRVVYNFEFVEENGGNIILLDPSRNLYVLLNSNSARWGTSKNNIPNLLFTGIWA